MNEEEAKGLLASQKEQLKENLKKYKQAEQNLDKTQSHADIFGPRDELEYQRMIKDIEASGKYK